MKNWFADVVSDCEIIMSLQPVSLTGDDFLNILNGIGKKDGIVVKIVDIFDFNGSWISGLHRFVGNKDILLNRQ